MICFAISGILVEIPLMNSAKRIRSEISTVEGSPGLVYRFAQ